MPFVSEIEIPQAAIDRSLLDPHGNPIEVPGQDILKNIFERLSELSKNGKNVFETRKSIPERLVQRFQVLFSAPLEENTIVKKIFFPKHPTVETTIITDNDSDPPNIDINLIPLTRSSYLQLIKDGSPLARVVDIRVVRKQGTRLYGGYVRYRLLKDLETRKDFVMHPEDDRGFKSLFPLSDKQAEALLEILTPAE